MCWQWAYGIKCVFWHQKSLNQLQKVPLLHVVTFYIVISNVYIYLFVLFLLVKNTDQLF